MRSPANSLFFLLTIFFFIGILKINAQNKSAAKKDSISTPADSSNFFSFKEDGFPYGNFGNLIPIENKLENFQNYHPRQAGLGNIGSPEKSLSLPANFSTGFSRSPYNFSYFGYLPGNRTFYISEKPYTRLEYILGQKQELNINVIHAHPLGKNCNVAFGFSRIRSTGFYQRQNTNNTSIDLNGWYRSPGKRYALLSDIYWTAENVAENGGIKNDSDFDNRNQLDRHLVAINLSSAQTKERFRGVWLKEFWSFGNVTDTISEKNDSTRIRTKISPSWAIVHTISISDEKYIYRDADPASGFYSTIFRDSALTNDSTYLWKLENGIWIERFDYHNSTLRKFSGKIGLRQEIGEITNDTIYKHFTNNFIDGAFRIDAKKILFDNLVCKGNYVFSGINNGDYSIKAEASTSILKYFFQYYIFVETALLHPQFLFSNYSGNNFRWKNDFYQTGINDVIVGMKGFGKKQPVGVSIGYFQFDSPVYFGNDKLPTQLIGSVKAITANFYWNTGTKHFKLRNDISWNKLPAASPIHLPELIVRESFYSDFFLFKSALRMQVGMDATWYSAYYADAYNPAISQFYVQNTKEIGNYFYLDPFVSFKIKPVKFFIKADHVNAGWFGRKYYQIPHYPGNDFDLKFGLSWIFND